MADKERERLDEVEHEIDEAEKKAREDHLIPDGKPHPGMFGKEPEETDAPAPG